MPTEFRLPELGEGITEADLLRVLVRPGDVIAVDQAVATIETEKATVEFEAPAAGTLVEIVTAAGSEAAVGAVIPYIDDGK